MNDHEHKAMNSDGVRALIEVTRGTRLEALVLLTALTELRRGEVPALRWANIDLERGTLFVTEALEQTRKYGFRFKPPKSKTCRRLIPLAPEVVAALRSHKAAQESARENAPFYIDNDLVFPNPDGRPWPPNTLTAQFTKIARALGLKGFTFKSLRHAFASLTLADGRPV